MQLHPPFRRATVADARSLAELVNIAGEGLPLHLWTKMAVAGADPWEVGSRRAQRESGSFSYRNAIVLEQEHRVIACLIGYSLPNQPEPISPDMPPMFVPLQELENLASDTWYLNVIATMPNFRGQGHGSALLAMADRIGFENRNKALSIIVSDANQDALRLYERVGYRHFADRPMVKEGWKNPGKKWLLLLKSIR
jgi:ribosomal protein S18 acetylase RimI-like enzyme